MPWQTIYICYLLRIFFFSLLPNSRSKKIYHRLAVSPPKISSCCWAKGCCLILIYVRETLLQFEGVCVCARLQAALQRAPLLHRCRVCGRVGGRGGWSRQFLPAGCRAGSRRRRCPLQVSPNTCCRLANKVRVAMGTFLHTSAPGVGVLGGVPDWAALSFCTCQSQRTRKETKKTKEATTHKQVKCPR